MAAPSKLEPFGGRYRAAGGASGDPGSAGLRDNPSEAGGGLLASSPVNQQELDFDYAANTPPEPGQADKKLKLTAPVIARRMKNPRDAKAAEV